MKPNGASLSLFCILNLLLFFFEEKKQKSGRTTGEQRGKQTQRGSSDAPSHPDL